MNATRFCSIDGCERPFWGRNLCQLHLRRLRKGVPANYVKPAEIERFFSKVEKSDTCWTWTAAIAPDGYGHFWSNGKSHPAHRWLYQQQNGPVPISLHMDHLCRNRSCVNPQHLEPVTPRINTLRGETIPAVNVNKTHCPSGHPYEGGNLYVGADGRRRCRACHRETQRRYLARRAVKK